MTCYSLNEYEVVYAKCLDLIFVWSPEKAFVTETSNNSLDVRMARLAQGDRSIFSEVFTHLWPRVLRLCTSMVQNDADAADAAQQAMMKILERAFEYDSQRPALPWALAIASWECRTLNRKRTRRREVLESTAPEIPLIGSEDEQIQRQLVEAALAAMGTLSETDKETLISTFWEAAASADGATLRKRRQRALTRLRAAFRRIYGLD
jgi:RNA polymerase sigma-70 factor (ECF subfamily)